MDTLAETIAIISTLKAAGLEEDAATMQLALDASSTGGELVARLRRCLEDIERDRAQKIDVFTMKRLRALLVELDAEQRRVRDNLKPRYDIPIWKPTEIIRRRRPPRE